MLGSTFRALTVVVAVWMAAGCTRSQYNDRFDKPEPSNSCGEVNLLDGEIDGAVEFRALFDCLNNTGSLADLEPLVSDLETSINPDTGLPYLEDVTESANLALAYEDAPELLRVFGAMAESGALQRVTPLGGELISTGFADAMLPVTLDAIDAGAIQKMLPPTAELLRDPGLPTLLDGTKDLLEDGIQKGWIEDLMEDSATILTLEDAQGNPALRPVVANAANFLASGSGEKLTPVFDSLLDDGTVDDLALVLRDLYNQGILQEMDTDLRPLFVQDLTGHSDFQGLVNIVDGTNQPLYCLGFLLTDNLAVMILDMMADRNEQDVQDLVDLLESALGLAGLLCNLPAAVQQHFDSLDALAKSGALNGLLPMLRVFQAQGRLYELADLLAELHLSGAVPDLEPVVLTMIDRGIVDRLSDLLPHFIDGDGIHTPAANTLHDMLDQLWSPTVGDDYTTAPLSGVLTVMGEIAGPASVPVADSLYELGKVIQTPGSGFSELPPALAEALAADPDAVLAGMLANFIDSGAAERGLDPLAQSIRSGNLSKVLPWLERVMEDGTMAEVIALLAGALEMLEIE